MFFSGRRQDARMGECKLLRRPRAPSQVLPPISTPQEHCSLKSDGFVSSSKQFEASSIDSTAYKRSISNTPENPPYSPDPSWIQSIVSPPPPSESAPTRRTFNTMANFVSPENTVLTRVTRDELKFVLDPLYRGRTALGTYVDGKSLIKPFKPRGPDSFPMRNPPVHPEVVHYYDTDDMKYYRPPAFTLEHFLIKLSHVRHIPLHRVKEIMYSRENYKKLTKMLAEKQESAVYSQDEVHAIDITPDDVRGTEPRIPQHQLLIEMASMIKSHVKNILNTDVRSVIKTMPRYGPSFRNKAAPHTEIILYEDDREERISFATKSLQSSEAPGKDAIVHTSKKYFQGSERSGSPFVCTSDESISPSEVAVLDSLANGGIVLSLKAQFIAHMPDLTPLMTTLVYLNISFNDFVLLPQEILQLTQLEVLKLRNNPLILLPDGISQLKNLRAFVFSFCLVTDLPDGLFDLENLEYLDMSYNKLSSIPNEIRRLQNLWSLKLDGNQLPAMSSGCTHLKLKNLSVQNTFMNPIFWKDSSRNTAQRLTDIAALAIYKEKLHEKHPRRVPEAVHMLIERRDVCECCKGAMFGPGLKIIRPAKKMFGINSLPFIFRACSPSCLNTFKRSTDAICDLLYGD